MNAPDVEVGPVPPPEPPPDVPNLKKARLQDAVAVAQTAASTVAPMGNPASSASATISTAWISDPAAGQFITDLDGIGTSIRSAFDDAVSHLQALAGAEPAMVPYDDSRGNASYFP